MKMVKLESLDDFNNMPETKWKIKQPAENDVRPDALETGKHSNTLLIHGWQSKVLLRYPKKRC